MKAKHALVHWHDYQHVAKSSSGPIIYNQLSVCNLILEFITPSDKLLNAANSNSVFFNCYIWGLYCWITVLRDLQLTVLE